MSKPVITPVWRVRLPDDEQFQNLVAGYAPEDMVLNDTGYTPETRAMLIWILEQTPTAEIRIPPRHPGIEVTFLTGTDATAFKTRWG